MKEKIKAAEKGDYRYLIEFYVKEGKIEKAKKWYQEAKKDEVAFKVLNFELDQKIQDLLK